MSDSPPPSWYEKPEYTDCEECGTAIDASETLCQSCIEEIRADQAYDAMIDGQFDAAW